MGAPTIRVSQSVSQVFEIRRPLVFPNKWQTLSPLGPLLRSEISCHRNRPPSGGAQLDVRPRVMLFAWLAASYPSRHAGLERMDGCVGRVVTF